MSLRPTGEVDPNAKSWSYWIDLEDVSRKYLPQESLTAYEPKYRGDVFAFGRAVYETQPQEAGDKLLRLIYGMGLHVAPGNLWMMPTYERLPYPFAVYWPLACAFMTEKKAKRRFDWFVWMDDDVLAEPADLYKLMAAADAKERPFVSALGYDRFEPHSPAVTEVVDGKIKKWVKAPPSGTHPVLHTGLCLAIFHRSLFDRVPEPWFGVAPPTLGHSGINPDWWWSMQLEKVGVKPYVCCDTNIIHLGRKLHIEREYSEQWQERSPRRSIFSETDAETQETLPNGAKAVPPPTYPNGRNEASDEPDKSSVEE